MVSYPVLTSEQQQGLPSLLKPASPLASKFEDSTHQLWLCDTVDGPMVLKCCKQTTVQQSTFWQAMNGLFSLNFPYSLADIKQTHDLVGRLSPLAVPDYIAAQASNFVFVKWLEGDDVDSEHITPPMIEQLADHLASLHLHTSNQWGPIARADFMSQDWSQKLQQTLISLVEQHPKPLPSDIIEYAITQAGDLNETEFAPIMMDLRWDQMLHKSGDLSALVDMDAFVIGPRALELVLLEYQLTPSQAAIFSARYERHLTMPDLTEQRECYRLLLFLMNSLGETDLEQWMNAEAVFDRG